MLFTFLHGSSAPPPLSFLLCSLVPRSHHLCHLPITLSGGGGERRTGRQAAAAAKGPRGLGHVRGGCGGLGRTGQLLPRVRHHLCWYGVAQQRRRRSRARLRRSVAAAGARAASSPGRRRFSSVSAMTSGGQEGGEASGGRGRDVLAGSGRAPAKHVRRRRGAQLPHMRRKRR